MVPAMVTPVAMMPPMMTAMQLLNANGLAGGH
jgi:hypothetical protein